MNPWGLWDLDPLGNHKHPCASRAGVYIGFRGALNPVDPSDSSYNLYLISSSTRMYMSVTSVNHTQHTEVSPPYPVHVALAGCSRLVEVT